MEHSPITDVTYGCVQEVDKPVELKIGPAGGMIASQLQAGLQANQGPAWPDTETGGRVLFSGRSEL